MHPVETLNQVFKALAIFDDVRFERSAGLFFQPKARAENLGNGALTITLRTNQNAESFIFNRGGLCDRTHVSYG